MSNIKFWKSAILHVHELSHILCLVGSVFQEILYSVSIMAYFTMCIRMCFIDMEPQGHQE